MQDIIHAPHKYLQLLRRVDINGTLCNIFCATCKLLQFLLLSKVQLKR